MVGYSTLVALHMPWFCSDSAGAVDTDRSERAREVVQQITETISTNLVKRQCFLERDPRSMSPWGLFFAYHISSVHMRSSSRDPDSLEVAKSLKNTFLTVDARWNVASTSLASCPRLVFIITNFRCLSAAPRSTRSNKQVLAIVT